MILVVMLFWDFLYLSGLFTETEAFLDICHQSDLIFKMFTYCTPIVRGTHVDDHFCLKVLKVEVGSYEVCNCDPTWR